MVFYFEVAQKIEFFFASQSKFIEIYPELSKILITKNLKELNGKIFSIYEFVVYVIKKQILRNVQNL